jgi:hypothetical protein
MLCQRHCPKRSLAGQRHRQQQLVRQASSNRHPAARYWRNREDLLHAAKLLDAADSVIRLAWIGITWWRKCRHGRMAKSHPKRYEGPIAARYGDRLKQAAKRY